MTDDFDAPQLEDHELDPELADVEPEAIDRQADPDASGGDEEVKP